MRTPPRQAFRRLAQLSLVATIGLVGLPVLAGSGNVASAVQTAQCGATASIYTGMSDPGLRLRKHNEPASGQNSWTGDQGIGWGWDTRFMAGTNGRLYYIETNGRLHKHRWNGSGWDNNGVSEVIDTGWTGWDDPRYHHRVTVDSNNHFYAALANGELLHQVYDETAKTWTKRVIGTGWGKYDQVLAAGDGVLYARDPAIGNGTLYRFRYDFRTQTWTQKDHYVGNGWNGYKQIVSPGGDVIYGMYPGGQLWWYRYLPEQNTWANSAFGNYKEKITDWTNVDEIAPAIDACGLGTVATDVQCKASANFFGSFTDNSFRIRPHTEPETGVTSWDPSRNIGQGWSDRFMGGPNGYKYFIRADGTLNRHRWNGSGWDNNGISEQIATGWTAWKDQNRYRVTVDASNHFYGVLTTGELQRSVYDELSKTWTQEIIDTGWGKYDQVFAAGDGVLYARDPNVESGSLYRFHYDWKSRRWLDYATNAGQGWNGYKQIVSPGADVIYGMFSSGDIWWYRFDPVTKTFANSSEGNYKEYILWWQNVSEIAADIDACVRVTPATVTPPSVPAPSNERAQMIYNATSQRLEIAYVSDDGILRRGYQSSPGAEVIEWQGLSGYQSFSGRVGLGQRQDGKLVAMARGTDSDARAFTQNVAGGNLWSTPANVKGAFASSPVVVRGANNLLSAFTVDSAGKLWYAEQFDAAGAFKPWRQATDSVAYTMSADFSVIPNGSSFEIAYRSATNSLVAVKKFTNGALSSTRVAAGLTSVGTPGVVVFSDSTVQVVARGADDKLYTQRETTAGFPGWTDISGSLTFTGSASVILNAHGIVEVAVRGADGTVYRGGQTAPGSAAWRTWETNLDTSVVDPTLTAAAGNEQRIFFRDGSGYAYLWYASAYTSSSGATMATAQGADTTSKTVSIKSVKSKAPTGK